MNLDHDIDPVNRTVDAHDLCYDIVNLSESVLLFRDFCPERSRQRVDGSAGKIENFPPYEFKVPPRAMATVPDERYRAATTDGREATAVFKFFGTDRPTRRTKRRISRRVLIETVLAPKWGAVPVDSLALALVEQVKAGKKAPQ